MGRGEDQGPDRIAARFMRQDHFEFDPQFKLFIVGNRKPSLRGVDEAIRRRLHLVPFTNTIPVAERDADLPAKLREEWPGILRWMIDGCLQWQERGLDPPEAVLAATDEYLRGEDAIGQWLEDLTIADPQAFASSSSLYDSWRDWAESAGEFVMSRKKFGQELNGRGYDSFRQGGGGQRGFIGIKLRGASF